jgi:hypothetical protein
MVHRVRGVLAVAGTPFRADGERHSGQIGPNLAELRPKLTDIALQFGSKLMDLTAKAVCHRGQECSNGTHHGGVDHDL